MYSCNAWYKMHTFILLLVNFQVNIIQFLFPVSFVTMLLFVEYKS